MLHNHKNLNLKPLIVALALSPGLVTAENQLSQIVVTANQIEQPLQNVTADVTIITAEDLRAQRATSLIEVLNTVPGISFTQSGPLGTATSLYMRGSDNQRTLILIDGVRVQDPSSTSGANLSDLIVSNIERIEIIKGAQSGVWGADAAAGVINIITKQSLDTTFNVEHGAFNTGRTALSTGFKLSKATVFLNGSYLSSEGFTAQAPVGERNLNQFENNGYQNTNLSARAMIPINENQSLTLSHNFTQARSEYDGWNNPNDVKRADTRTDLSQLIYQIGSTKLSAEQSLFTTEQLDDNTPDIVKGETQSISLSHQHDNLLIGANYSQNKASSDKFSWATGDNVLLKDTTHSKSVFATHSNQWRSFTFNQALRYDDYSNFGSEITGKLGAKMAITENQSVAVNYGTAYNAPSLVQILNPWGTGNPDLNPEKSVEASVTYQLHGLSATYFDKSVDDLINWQGGQFQNVKGKTTIKGVEAEYKQRFDSWQFAVNYTHLDTEKANGEPLARRPDNQVGLSLNWFVTDQLDINLNGQYIAKRSGNADPVTENYSVWNGVINYDINNTASAYLKLNNIFNTYYQTVAGYATAQHSAYAGLTVQF
ncbi:TonB-dependent receptor [Thiomicrospira microaerophila]|uniref:TonB-dependent receptor plug domain-containing protein n=1 Tax=Thiomicrospira microaerophila TaxID=406020 RepID=UPI00200E0E06|nr:TonB-dependent receptor [Thiomicrospira microaerophila]UQB41554.1 TonB-dependent receptor [Thiomicrospira microaerophila]